LPGQETLRLGEIGLGEAADVPMCPHDPVPRVEPMGILLLGMADLGGNDAGRDGAGDALSNLVLDRTHIREVAVIAVGPEMMAGLGVDQLRGDPHTIAGAAHAAFDHVADAKFGPYLDTLRRKSSSGPAVEMSERRAERRFAAILAVDVAGYSRLMSMDEEGTLAALRTIRRELGDPKIKEHRGRIVKTTGDGLLVEFASVVDAVRCAVDVQREMALRNAGIPPERRIEFRMGINLGDIIVEDGDIFGDGVNIAARLEALAEPGGICASRVVRDQVRDKLDFFFEDTGEQQVKNIARPVRTHRILLESTPEIPGVEARPADPAPTAARGAAQAVDRGAAVRQHERRRRAGVLLGGGHRGHHHQPVAQSRVFRDLAQHVAHLQGPGRIEFRRRRRVGCGEAGFGRRIKPASRRRIFPRQWSTDRFDRPLRRAIQRCPRGPKRRSSPEIHPESGEWRGRALSMAEGA
jgi:class 3 adenylate cyclase